jgi:hypothetical protein
VRLGLLRFRSRFDRFFQPSLAVSIAVFATSIGSLLGSSYSTFCMHNCSPFLFHSIIYVLQMAEDQYTSSVYRFYSSRQLVLLCLNQHRNCCFGDSSRLWARLLVLQSVQPSSGTSTGSKSEGQPWVSFQLFVCSPLEFQEVPIFFSA